MTKPSLPQRWPKSAIYYYAIAVLSVAAAIIATELITRLLHAEAIASSMLCAVIFVAWFGGFGPALLAIALALLGFHYYLTPPIGSFGWKHELFAVDISEVPRLILFSFTALFVALLVSAQRKAAQNLRRSGDDLQAAMEGRRRIEAALVNSTMYLTEAQRLSRTGSFGWNVVSGEIVWSEETFRIFQYDPTVKPALELVVQRTHPEDRAAVQETIDRASGDGKDFDHEYRLLMPDGSVKYVHAVAHAARDASGGREFFGAVTDVTAAKEAERKLRRSEAYLAEAQRLSHTGSWAWNARRREFVFRSPEAHRMLGLDPENEAVPQQPLWDRVHREDRDRVIEMVRQALRGRTDFEGDYRIVLPDGSTRYVHSVGHTVVGDEDEVTELVGTHVDVTEQHLAREALQKAVDEIKKSEDRLRLVIDTIPTLVWRAGPDGVPAFLNQPALDYTGISSEQAATAWPRAFHPDDKKGMLKKWSAIRQSGMPGGLEARLRRFDGEYRWFLFQALPLRDEAGNIVKWYGSSTDIEDRKQAESALHAAQSALAHASRVAMLGEISATIAHEVNQPLAAIVANAQACLRFLRHEKPRLDDVRGAIEWIVKDGNRASEVIQRVRALLKKADTHKAPLDVNDIINEVGALLQRELAAQRVALRLDLAPALPLITADRVQLQQVIINLVMNGADAMQTIANGPRALMIRSRQAEPDQVLVAVKDSGVGIAPGNADRLFAPFFSTKPSGLGMGLAICHSIIEDHGGRLWAADNDEGPGATFQFALPSQPDGPHALAGSEK